ncbi:SRSF protein kinase 1 [Seminavis robusta]|uniref:non-specific serine/threonine protein kinase n=1 Tax=Seminavis robusta TaxID=568900 RepID=A0A9N8DGV8_9STRA|nr:SRSF protein kinase 1 [Seminavis robusta]|eukprot:Sro61_g034970.1 SRSF protein kinase 1 (1111) ;mRNA; r:52262-55877
MQFFRGKNKKDSNNNNSNNIDDDEGEGQQSDNNNTKMQESDLLSELDQLASEPTTSAEFSDDPQHATTTAPAAGSGTVMDVIVAGVTSNLSGGSSSAAAGAASGGVESLKMLDSDDGADMDIFDDDDDDYGGGREDFAEKSPSSWVGGGPKKQVSPALREEIKDLLSTPLTIPTLVQPQHKRDEFGTSDDDHDDDDDDDAEGEEDKSSESGEDYTDDEDEGESGYKPGGYHPVNVGDVFNQGRYVVIKKLGWGHFSTVWMVKDRKAQAAGKGTHFYALKVQKSAEHYTEAAMDEVELLDCIAQKRKHEATLLGNPSTDEEGVTAVQMVDHAKFSATLHDSFFHTGPNGRHMCMVFSMLGCNLLSVIKAFNYRGIPIEVVKRMIQGVCKGLDFLHRRCKIIHTDLKPENVLLQFPDQFDDDDEVGASGMASLSIEDEEGKLHGVEKSIQELEAALQDPTLPADERKKIKKRLKRKRQKEKKRAAGKAANNDEDDDDDDDQMDESDDSEDSPDEAAETASPTSPLLSAFTDLTMEKIISSASAMMAPLSGDATESPAESHSRVKRRLNHSPFVLCNFGPHVSELDAKLVQIMRDSVKMSSASAEDMKSRLVDAEKLGGVAEVSFMLRAFAAEEELADAITIALGGVTWDGGSRDDVDRVWRCKISIPTAVVENPAEAASASSASVATYFEIGQKTRTLTSAGEKQDLSELAMLVGANLTDESDDNAELPDAPGSPSASKSPPFSLFKVKFPINATQVVLSLLESRLPGLAFLTYRRDEGIPQLDNILFGSRAKAICNHSLAMRIKDAPLNPLCSMATALVGFDLRLVKDFGASRGDGVAAFDLNDLSNEKVLSWWRARNPLKDRLKAFTGTDPSPEMFTVSAPEDQRESRKTTPVVDQTFVEGGKKLMASESSTEPSSSREPSQSSSVARHSSRQPDLRDKDMLMTCRAVIVDLGNACWTHRHFSEDIQTRQYRAPEVLIGAKYDTSADIWSLGCMTFELLTGDLLFDPRAGEDYDRDEDHLAMFQELLGKMPKRLAVEGKYSKNFFDKKGNLKHIKHLKFWPIQDVLVEKYHFSEVDAHAVADFMTPLLDFDPNTRATALEALRSPWLKDT